MTEEQQLKKDTAEGSCPDCHSCGIEGRCNANDCKYLFNHPNCKIHLEHLLLTYKCNKQLLAHIYKQDDRYKELIEEWEDIWYNTSEP